MVVVRHAYPKSMHNKARVACCGNKKKLFVQLQKIADLLPYLEDWIFGGCETFWMHLICFFLST